MLFGELLLRWGATPVAVWRLVVTGVRLGVAAAVLVQVPVWVLVAALPVALWSPVRVWFTAPAAMQRYRRINPDDPVCAAAARVAARFDCGVAPVLLAGPDLESLAVSVAGARRTELVVVSEPVCAWAAAGEARLAEAVLAHEFAHLYRRHVPLRLLGSAVVSTSVLALWATWLFELAGVMSDTVASMLSYTIVLAPSGGPAGLSETGLQTSGPVSGLVVAVGVSAVQVLLLLAADRAAESEADADAARVGYGAELAVILNAEQFPRWRVSSLRRHHPAPQQRLARLARQARRQPNGAEF
jgi:Zn-dependent protease with chaperone function